MQHVYMNGHLTIHSAPSALRQHIEWGLNSLLASPQNYSWRDQPLAPGTARTSLDFRAAAGTAAKAATALKIQVSITERRGAGVGNTLKIFSEGSG